ncbi:MAG: helix-turn-helix transcriptional regulator [Myxococcota bacterium]
MDARAHRLIDRIYAAAIEPAAWQEVVEEISAIFGGSPVNLGFLVPGDSSLGMRFSVGLREGYHETYFQHLLNDTPWSTRFMKPFIDRFGDMSEVLSHLRLDETGLYTDWMKPQGLAPVWPAGHTLVDRNGDPIGGFTIFRTEGGEPFTEEEFALVDPFVPHFRRALHTHLELQGAQQVRTALAEAMDLLPTGLLLLDERRGVVLKNRGADRILDLDDGLRLDRNGPSAEDARENAQLQVLIADAMDAKAGSGSVATGFLAVSRPSGKKSFAVMVAPLLNEGTTVVRDAAVAIFVADPAAGRLHDPEVLGAVYSLTHSEAELVRLLAQGLSLEEAADARGVSMNTARSHLKRAFAKTGTSRQGELVRLVISGVGSMGEE